MVNRLALLAVGLILGAFSAGGNALYGQTPGFAQLAELRRVNRDLRDAQELAGKAEWAAAAGFADRAIQNLQQLLGAPTPATDFSWARAEIELAVALHAKLSAEVPDLPPLGNLQALAEKLRAASSASPVPSQASPDMTASAPPTATANPPPPASAISFVQHVAPILVAKCGRCHVADDKGRVSFATYETLMNKPDLVHVGQPDTSELVTVIESGDMPRGPQKVTPEELAQLRQWIAAGAVCAEQDRTTELAALAGERGMAVAAAPPATPPPAAPLPGSGDGLVSFSRQIAPVLVENCAGCHIDGRQVRGGLNLGTFALLGRGGDSGTLFTGGAGQDSLLVKKLRGTAGGMQMPAGRPALPSATIELIARWIDEGGRFDGFSPTASLREVSARARAGEATHEQLRSEREQRAIANWSLIMGGKQPTVAQSDQFILLGPDASADLKTLGDVADQTVREVAKQLKVNSREPLVKGNVALYVFQTRYDFGEFGKMIEQRDLPRETYWHWGNTTLDAYLVLQAKPADYPALEPTLARSLTAIYLRGLGTDVPNWFADGYGVWLAAEIYAGNSFVQEWQTKGVQLLTQSQAQDDFLTGKLADHDAALVASQFIGYLKNNAGNDFNKFMKDLKAGEGFARSFENNFGATPQDLVLAISGTPSESPANPPGEIE